jgi:glycosyltransferase involved in cell wall biosynthesis
MKVAAIVPAYNEAQRIGPVLDALDGARLVDTVIVVDDGSRDGTAQAVPGDNGIRTLVLPRNRGKGGAMKAGVDTTDADVVLFLDADLVGLEPGQIDALVAPVLAGEADMAIGVFRGGRYLTDLSQRLVPYISGQRAMRREVFLEVPGLEGVRSGVEVALTRYAKSKSLRVKNVPLDGVTHVMKEEKLGALRGVWGRLRMYYEIGKCVVLDGRFERVRRFLAASFASGGDQRASLDGFRDSDREK